MNEAVKSVNGVPIRLTAERWMHITMGHPEMADYYFDIVQVLESPQTVYAGNRDEMLAVSELPHSNGKNLILCIERLVRKTDLLSQRTSVAKYTNFKNER